MFNVEGIAQEEPLMYLESCFIYLFKIFWQYWGFNSGPHACWAGSEQLEISSCIFKHQ
jgi:hypothetical protein